MPENIIAENGNYRIHTRDRTIDAVTLISLFLRSETRPGSGRGLLKVFQMGGRTIAARKYIHGGILRFMTGDKYPSAARALREMEVLLYLEGKGVPVVHPVCVIVTKDLFTKNLYIATDYIENAVDFIDFLRPLGKRDRLRAVRKLAGLFHSLVNAGVYHPDLHLRNVLVTAGGQFVLLDFDRARKKAMGAGEAEKMLWRLYRYALKMTRKGAMSIDVREIVLFLRTYERLSRYKLMGAMEQGARRRFGLFKLGWHMESLLYGGKK